MASSDGKRAVSAENMRALDARIPIIEVVFSGKKSSVTLSRAMTDYMALFVQYVSGSASVTAIIDPKGSNTSVGSDNGHFVNWNVAQKTIQGAGGGNIVSIIGIRNGGGA